MEVVFKYPSMKVCSLRDIPKNKKDNIIDADSELKNLICKYYYYNSKYNKVKSRIFISSSSKQKQLDEIDKEIDSYLLKIENKVRELKSAL